MAVSINNGFDTIYDALNKKLTFSDNILSTLGQFNVSVDSSGTPLKKTQFKLDKNQESINGLITIDCYEEKANGVVPPPSAIFISFIKSENYILINNIKGLTPNISYTIKVLTIT